MNAPKALIETQWPRPRPMEPGDLDEFVALHADAEVTEFIHPLDRAAAAERLPGTKRGRACIEWGFSELDVPYLTAMIYPGNARSIRVAERLGMTPLRDDLLLGEPVVVYKRDRAAPK
jgi:hypothetical protein